MVFKAINPPKKRSPFLLLFVSFLIAFALTFFYLKGPKKNAVSAPPTAYHAVFLTNGQVYFGKLSPWSLYVGSTYVLSDVYYLQSTPADKKNPELSLIKLGSELHGPEDTLYISKTQILLYEVLKKDSKVVQAIQSFNR